MTISKLATAALAGIVTAGMLVAPAFAEDAKTVKTDAAGEKAACKGHNECKGKGNCKTDAHACKGQNACKGQGGCKGEAK